MIHTEPLTVPWGLYSLSFRLRNDFSWNSHPGSTLRGIWGNALRQLACKNRDMARCEGCHAAADCVYAEVFAPRFHATVEQPDPFVPYVIEPPRGRDSWKQGELMSFKWIVFKKALKQLPILLHAWVLAFKTGIGTERIRGDFVSVELLQDDALFTPEHASFFEPQLWVPAIEAGAIQLNHITPVRIERNKRPLRPEELTPGEFMNSLLRRMQHCFSGNAHPDLGAIYPEYLEVVQRVSYRGELIWEDELRYSFSQHQKIPLGGVMGVWQWSGQPDDIRLLTPILYLGQWLHAGKETVFGLGQYRMDVLESGAEAAHHELI